MKIKKSEDGFTLLEVIMAISILSIGLLAVATMQGISLKGDAFAQSRTEASTWGQDKMEELIAMPYDHANLNPGTYSDTHENYTVVSTIANGPVANTKSITLSLQFQGAEINQLTCIRSSLLD